MKRLPLRVCMGLMAAGLAACTSARSAEPNAATGSGPERPASLPHGTWSDRAGQPVDPRAALEQGKSVMLVFWQTWCATCIQEAPLLAEAARQYPDAWLILGVISGPDGRVDEAAVDRTVAKLNLPYAQIRDRDLALSDAFGVQGTPTLVALAPDGTRGWTSHAPPEDWEALHRRLQGPGGQR